MKPVLVVVLACAGCFSKPEHFVSGIDGGGGGDAGDAGTDAPTCSSYDAWFPKGSFNDLNTVVDEFGPWLSPDGLDLYFTRDGRVVRTHRATRGQPFDAPLKEQLGLPVLGSGGDHEVFLSDDQQRIWFNNGSGAIATAVRVGGTESWTSATELTDLQGTTAQLTGAYVSSDGRTMIVAGGPDHPGEALRYSVRASVGDPFPSSQLLGSNLDDSTTNDSNPSATANERLLVWQRDIGSTPTLMFSEGDGTYTNPTAIDLPPGVLRRSPHITRDGLTLVFETEDGTGNSDLAMVERLCIAP